MANPMKGEAIVRVQAGEFTLAITLGTAVTIQKDNGGKSLSAVIDEMQKSQDVELMLSVLWACLKKHHNFTKDEVADLVSLPEMVIWSNALGEAMSDPDAKEGDARPPKAKAKSKSQ